MPHCVHVCFHLRESFLLLCTQTVRAVPACALQWVNGFPGGTDNEELLLRLARLLATLATEIIDSLKRLENGVISMAAVGLSVDDAAMLEVKQVRPMLFFFTTLTAFALTRSSALLPTKQLHVRFYLCRVCVEKERVYMQNV